MQYPGKPKKFFSAIIVSLFTLIVLLSGNGYGSFENQPDALESGNFFSDFFKNPFEEKQAPSYSLEVSAQQEEGGTKVVPMGTPIGVKLTTEGVLVTGFSEVQTADGNVYSPAKEAGAEIGDIILYMNDAKIESAEQISDFVRMSEGQAIHVSLKRSDEIKMIEITPRKASSSYKLGMYVRNVSAGIGTLTFVNPETKTFAALGHGITDTDSGGFLNLSQGAITNSYILSLTKGESGTAGELHGILSQDSPNTGVICRNNELGVYGGYLDQVANHTSVPIAEIDEIQTGPAKVLTTIAGSEPKYYDIEVVKIVKQTKESQKSMVIRVTDPRLLTRTGGIIQGMSGSPILQNGKLIGAVTHVFVNDPNCGYAIFAKWMDQETQKVQF